MKPPSTSDPNSLAAARSVEKSAPAQRARVFALIEDRGHIAATDISTVLGIDGNSVRPRLVELEAEGRIEKHGKGKTPSGRACHLYRVRVAPVVLLQERAFDLPELVPHG